MGELEARQNTPNNMKTSTSIQRTMALKDFCDNASKQLDKLKEDRDNAEKAFTKCLEHYGEDRKTMDTNTFFAILKRFCDSWKTAEEENIKREKLKRDRELKKEMESKKNNANLLADELKKKMNRRPVNHYDQDDVKVSFTFYPHFGMSPLKEKKFLRNANKENVLLTSHNKCV